MVKQTESGQTNGEWSYKAELGREDGDGEEREDVHEHDPHQDQRPHRADRHGQRVQNLR